MEDKIRRWAESKGGDDEVRKINKDVQDAVNKKLATVPREGAAAVTQVKVSTSSVQPVASDGKNKKKKKKEKKQSQGFSATCFGRQREIEVPFKPDNVRPVYCKDCLKKARRGDIKIKQEQTVENPEVNEPVSAKSVSLNELGKQTVDFKGKPLGVKLPANISRPGQSIAVKSAPKTVTPPQPIISTATPPIKAGNQPPVTPNPVSVAPESVPVASKPVSVTSQPSIPIKTEAPKPAVARPEPVKAEVTQVKATQPAEEVKIILPKVDLLRETAKALEEENRPIQQAKSVNLLNPQSNNNQNEKSVNQGQVIEL